MARGRSRKRGGGGGRGRRQKNAEVNPGGGAVDDSVNPPPVPFDLSLVKNEPVDDDDLGYLGLLAIKQEPGEKGSGLVDKLETQLDTESTRKQPPNRSNPISKRTPEPTRKSSRISERLSNRSSDPPLPRPPSPPKRQRRSKSKPVTPSPPQLSMMNIKKELDSEEEERYDITRVKLEVLTPPHEAEDLGHGSVTAVVAKPAVEQTVPNVKKPLIKPPVLKLNRSVGVGVTVTVEKEGREEVGVVVEGVEEPTDPEMVKITTYTPLSSVLREKYYVVDPDKDKAVFEKPLGYMVKSALMGYHDLTTNKLPKLTRKMNLQAAHSHALASSLSEKHQLQMELLKQNEKYRSVNSSLGVLTDHERHRAEDAWKELDRTKLHSKTYDEGLAQQHFLGKKFTDAVDTIRANCDKRLKDLEMDRGKLAKENEALVRGKELFQKKWRKVNGRVGELERVVEELKGVVGGLIGVIGEESGKGGKEVEAAAVKVFGDVVKGCFGGRGEGVKEMRDAVFGGKGRVDCPFDSTGILVGNIVEVEGESDGGESDNEFVEVGDNKPFDGGEMFSELAGDDVRLVVENFGGVMDGLDGFLDVIGGDVPVAGGEVGKPEGMEVDEVGGDQFEGGAEDHTTEDVGETTFDENAEWWLQVVVKDQVIGSEARPVDEVVNEPEVAYNLLTGERVGEEGHELPGGNEGNVTQQAIKELPVVVSRGVVDEVVVKESPTTDEQVKAASVVDQQSVNEPFVADVVGKEPQVADLHVFKELPIVDDVVFKETSIEDEVVVKETVVPGEVVVKETPVANESLVVETEVADKAVVKGTPMVDGAVAQETSVLYKADVEEPAVGGEVVVKATPVVDEVVVKATPVVDEVVVKETSVADKEVVQETPVVDEVVVKKPIVADEAVVKETPVVAKEHDVVNNQVSNELQVGNEAIAEKPQVSDEHATKAQPITDEQVTKKPPITEGLVPDTHPLPEPVVTELHPGVVLTTLPNSRILFNGRTGYEPTETISDWPEDLTDNLETNPTHLFVLKGTKRQQDRKDRYKSRKMRKLDSDNSPPEPSNDKPDETVRDRLSKQVGAIVPVSEVGGKCEKRKLEDQVNKVKQEKSVRSPKKQKKSKGSPKSKDLMVELFGDEDVDERERGQGEYDFGSGSSGDSLYSELARDLDLSESEEEDGRGEVFLKEMEDHQSVFESLVLSPLSEITADNSTVIYPLVSLLKKFNHPAQPFYTMMIDSTEDDLNQDLHAGEKTAAAPLVPRFRHILACVVQICKLGGEYKDFWKTVIEYLSDVIRDDSKRDLEDEFLIKNVGRLVGGICYEFKGDREGVGIVMEVCLSRGPYCYAFAYGAFCSYSDMLGWSKDVMGWRDLRVESKGLVWYLCRNVKWSDVVMSKTVMEFLRVGLGLPVLEDSLVVFLGEVVGEIKSGGGGNFGKVISLVCVGLGVGWFEKSFCVLFDGWLKEFGEGGISGGGFKVLVEGMGMAAVTFRRDDLPVDLKCVTVRLDIICRMKNMPDDIIVIANDYQGQIAQLKLRDPGEPIDGWGEYLKKSAVKETKCFGKKKKHRKRCEGRRGGGAQVALVPVPLQGSSSVVGRGPLLPTPERSAGGSSGGWVRGSNEGMQHRGKGGWQWSGGRGGEARVSGDGRGGARGRGEGGARGRGRGDGRGGARGRGEGGARGRGRGERGGRARGRGGRGGPGF